MSACLPHTILRVPALTLAREPRLATYCKGSLVGKVKRKLEIKRKRKENMKMTHSEMKNELGGGGGVSFERLMC
jgi:hypothetical protein